MIRGMTSQVTKAVGKSAGSSGKRGSSPLCSPGGSGGGPRNPGPAGSGAVLASAPQVIPIRAASKMPSKETDHQQGASQQNTTQQSGAAQAASQSSVAREQSVGSGGVTNQVNQDGAAARQSRKSAVPPGTRRSPSHIKAGPSPVIGVQVPGQPNGGPGQAPGTVQPGAPAQAIRRGRERRVPLRRALPEGQQADSPAPAGTASGSTSRFTHTVAQTVHGGDTSGSVQTSEQKPYLCRPTGSCQHTAFLPHRRRLPAAPWRSHPRRACSAAWAVCFWGNPLYP